MSALPTLAPAHDYYAVPAVSASGINRFLNDSPLHYWLESPFNPDRKPSPETPALVFGRLAHCMALTPELAQTEFSVMPEINRRTNEGKAQSEEFLASAAGTVVSAQQWHLAIELRDALRQNSAVRQLLGQGTPEEPATWTRDDGPLPCKAKFDYLRQGLVIDYKTTLCTRLDEFARTIAKFGYHRQLAWYMDAAEKHHGERPRGAVIIAQNKDLPEDIGVFALDADGLAYGQQEANYAYSKICERMETMDWRSHPPEIQSISLPGWYAKNAA